jgi:tetratricopeptide (TPR) repeat protein
MLQITQKTSLQEISEYIKSLREQKGKEKETLSLSEKAIRIGQGFVISTMWEKALSYQHMVMSGNKKALLKMEAAILSASKYVNENKLKEWESRNFRFLGRLYDYKNEFGKAIIAYKKSIALVDLDPEPFREYELYAFLSYPLIMSGKVYEGLKMSKNVYKKFDTQKKA